MIWTHLKADQFKGNGRPLPDTGADPGGCRPGLLGSGCGRVEGEGVVVEAASHLINIKAGEAINK